MNRMTTEWLACIARGGALLKSPETAQMASEILRLRSRVTDLEAQVATARADERERCAKACEVPAELLTHDNMTDDMRARVSAAHGLAAAIRALPAAGEDRA